MGMAASQARYLALVARQSNCEYEGQQINQARTVLSNQTANLFNQMLGLKVPVPPSVQNFTKVQYSFKDGENAVTIDSWKQLATPDEDFNYSVKYHYYSDVYTGSQKKMADPQVQVNTEGSEATPEEVNMIVQKLTVAKAEYDKAQKEADEAKLEYDKAKSELVNAQLQKSVDESTLASVTQKITDLTNAKKDYKNYQETTTYASTKSATFDSVNNAYTVTKADDTTAIFKSYDKLTPEEKETFGAKIDSQWWTDTGISTDNVYINMTNGTFALKDDLENSLDTKGIDRIADIPVFDTIGINAVETKYESYNSQITTLEAQKDELTEKTAAGGPDDQAIADAQTNLDTAEATWATANNQLEVAQSAYNILESQYESVQAPTYIGNCKLQLLESLSVDEETEIKQVIKDMIAQDINANINNCIDENGNYTGGIYKFTLRGIDYYTTLTDLYNSYNSGNQYGNNNVDAQAKLPYYNASYVSTKIEHERKALLETDGNGRFSSVRFEDDTMKYELNMETITDDIAYQDAMNQYYYENAKYDKTVQDINAKTSLIQQEDLQLELRLKQLETERNAMVAEIEAVQKVVKDNVDKSFKTFNG